MNFCSSLFSVEVEGRRDGGCNGGFGSSSSIVVVGSSAGDGSGGMCSVSSVSRIVDNGVVGAGSTDGGATPASAVIST